MTPPDDDRNGRRLWLDAGRTHLIDGGGAAGVKVRALAERAGLTTGSFYHHFDGLRSFLDELAEHAAQIVLPVDVVEAADPIDGLVLLGQWLHSPPERNLDVALRRWATHDEKASAALAERDGRLLEVMADLFAAAGLYQRRSRVCAHLLLPMAVADFRSTEPPTDDDIRTLVLGLARREA